MAYVIGEPTVQQYFDANGDPLVNGSIEFYLSGTSDPTPIYSDSSGTSLGTSLTLNSIGAPQSSGGTAVALFFKTGIAYKIIRKDAAGSPIEPTIDPYYAQTSGYVTSISELEGLQGSTGQQVRVAMYHNDADNDRYGGDWFIWGAGVHNGITIIDPDRTFPADWTNSTQVTAWFATTGGTVDAWIRTGYTSLHTSMAGVKFNGDKDYSTVNATALNALSALIDGHEVICARGECVYDTTWDLSSKRFRLVGQVKAKGTANPGSKLVWLPLTGTAIDMSESPHSSIENLGIDGGWIQENDPSSVPVDYPDSVTSIGVVVDEANYSQFRNVEILRFSKPFFQNSGNTTFNLSFYDVSISSCYIPMDFQGQMNALNVYAGTMTNFGYGPRILAGGASINFTGTVIQIQGKDQVANSWEEADGYLFNFSNCFAVNLNGTYHEINGTLYANGQQTLGVLDNVEVFNFAPSYIASRPDADPALYLITANDCNVINMNMTSTYRFPANQVWIDAQGTTDAHLISGSNSAVPSGNKLVDNSYPPVLFTNGSVNATATYGANNKGLTYYDGRMITYTGLLEVTNWGSLTAGQYISIKLPTGVSTDSSGLDVIAIGDGLNSSASIKYYCQISTSQNDQIRVFLDSAPATSVTTSDAPASVRFWISYPPRMPATN